MKKIFIIIILLILSLQGFSQGSLDAIVNNRISDSLSTLPSDTIKTFSMNSNVIIYPDTLQIKPNTMAQIELGILYRNTTTGVILTGNKIVTIQRSGSGAYSVVYDPGAAGNITKVEWTLVPLNGLLLVRLTGKTGVVTRGTIYKYHKLTSSQ